MVAKNGYSKSGRILGVSNNAIKKRIEKIKSR
jgi:biotin operon repressor